LVERVNDEAAGTGRGREVADAAPVAHHRYGNAHVVISDDVGGGANSSGKHSPGAASYDA
jgi:hypothetical protein